METNLFKSILKNQNLIGFIHRIYNSYLKNKRNFLASTKTKSEVRGGGRKPWRQKGTGNARAGSIRSPLWKGGGVIFGPKPRIVYSKINKKEKQLALISSLYLKKDNLIFIDQDLIDNFNSFKTQEFIKLLNACNLTHNEKILFILSKKHKNIFLASRNLNNVEISLFDTLNIEQILKTKYLIISNVYLEKLKFLYDEK